MCPLNLRRHVTGAHLAALRSLDSTCSMYTTRAAFATQLTCRSV